MPIYGRESLSDPVPSGEAVGEQADSKDHSRTMRTQVRQHLRAESDAADRFKICDPENSIPVERMNDAVAQASTNGGPAVSPKGQVVGGTQPDDVIASRRARPENCGRVGRQSTKDDCREHQGLHSCQIVRGVASGAPRLTRRPGLRLTSVKTSSCRKSRPALAKRWPRRIQLTRCTLPPTLLRPASCLFALKYSLVG